MILCLLRLSVKHILDFRADSRNRSSVIGWENLRVSRFATSGILCFPLSSSHSCEFETNPQIPQNNKNLLNIGGTWGAQLVKCTIFYFSSGHDLRGVRSSPASAPHWAWKLLESSSPCAPPCLRSLSKNKKIKIKKRRTCWILTLKC